MIHEYIHVGGGALYCKPCEVLVTDRDSGKHTWRLAGKPLIHKGRKP